jgi:hypothetical protein
MRFEEETMSKLVGIGELSASVGLHVNTLRKLADSTKIVTHPQALASY